MFNWSNYIRNDYHLCRRIHYRSGSGTYNTQNIMKGRTSMCINSVAFNKYYEQDKLIDDILYELDVEWEKMARNLEYITSLPSNK